MYSMKLICDPDGAKSEGGGKILKEHLSSGAESMNLETHFRTRKMGGRAQRSRFM